MNVEEIRKLVEEFYPRVVEVRREIHRHPELKLQEYETARLVASELESAGWRVYRNYADTTAVVGVLEGGRSGPVRAFRADMDALPIQEETGLPYASEVAGVMHACGHDFHTAILVGVAHVLSHKREELPGVVVLVFQPGEEGGFGGKILTDGGMIEEFGIQYIVGQHLFPSVEFGKIGYRVGLMTANSDSFEVVVEGKGGHGARPEESIDPISVASHISIAFATVHSREIPPVEPTVITVGSIVAGSASNVIPDKAFMKGTIRTFGEKNRKYTIQRVKEVAEGIATTFRAKAVVNVTLGYPSVVNDEGVTTRIVEAANLYLGEDSTVELEHPSLGGEDFAYYLQKVPGAFYRLGVGPNYPLHNSKFAPDERVLGIGMGVNSTIALLLP